VLVGKRKTKIIIIIIIIIIIVEGSVLSSVLLPVPAEVGLCQNFEIINSIDHATNSRLFINYLNWTS